MTAPLSPTISRSDSIEASDQIDDVWIRSGCELCLNFCGILAHRVNGQVVKIEGDPDNPHNKGFVCAKGNAGMLSQFSPFRITKPMKRGNPEKGMGIDPQLGGNLVGRSSEHHCREAQENPRG